MPSASPSSPAASEPVSISADPLLLDFPWMIHGILDQYWSSWYSAGQLRQAIEKSLCFGAYRGQRQIGMARIITDHSIFSFLTDVLVDEQERGKGVGSALIAAATEHPSVVGTICILQSRPQNQLFYFARGFRLVDKTSGMMQKEPSR